ncbi:MAG TPA: HlyD family efflux transporter periplasmic adaptor subunit [Acidobacteriota bacterium]|nr:HlyD family efflux transporter periplasmic adaptor subunit [Acidobacteriota bacterium]
MARILLLMPAKAIMDIPRSSSVKRKKLIRRAIFLVLLGVAVLLTSLGLSRLKPAAPAVEASTIWPDTVKRGPMVRQVRGLGTLVPKDVLWIPAVTSDRVERILMRPGAKVGPDTILLVLSNPELELQALDAEYAVKAAEAEYNGLKVRLESQQLTQQAELARIQSEFYQSKLQADRDEMLAKEGLLADLTLHLSRSTSEQLEQRQRIEEKRLEIQAKSNEAELAVQRAQIDKLRALAELRRSEVEALKVRAGAAGVLQELPVQVGQQLAAGTIIAKVAQPERLHAELKVPETQVKDVAIGQPAQIDTRNGIIPGTVSRIDPAVREGTVTVDVDLIGELSPGARPDLSVEGIIEIERLADVVYVGRPAFGQPNSTVGMFRIEEDGKTAVRVPVKLGRSSVNTIEIVEGLKPGDRVILSDTSSYDGYDRIRLK